MHAQSMSALTLTTHFEHPNAWPQAQHAYQDWLANGGLSRLQEQLSATLAVGQAGGLIAALPPLPESLEALLRGCAGPEPPAAALAAAAAAVRSHAPQLEPSLAPLTAEAKGSAAAINQVRWSAGCFVLDCSWLLAAC
jgi:hypothetical protein